MASTVTKTQLLKGTRTTLGAFPVRTTLKSAVGPTGMAIEMERGDVFKNMLQVGTLIEVGIEVMMVADIPEKTDTVIVVRGHRETTPASHKAKANLNIIPAGSWTDEELLKYIDDGTRWLKPSAWTFQTSAEFTWALGDNFVNPAAADGISYPDGNYIHHLERKNSNGKFIDFHGFDLEGSKVRFRGAASKDETMRATFIRFQPILATLASTLDNDEFRESIELYSAHKAQVAVGAVRTRFAEFSAALNDRTSTPDELIRSSFNLLNLAERSRNDHGRPMPSSYASTHRPVRS